MNTRVLVRAFHDDFTTDVIRAADSIVQMSERFEVQQKAIEWKINTNKASAGAAFQSIPEISLVDSWVLAQQMRNYFETGNGKTIFAEATPIALNTALTALEKIENLAKTLNTEKKYLQLSAFVVDYANKNPLATLEFSKDNLLRELTTFLNVADTTYITTLGSSAQAMSDLSDRIGVFKSQLQLQLEWQKELITLSWENDSIADNYLSRLDTLSARLDAFAVIARESPETMGLIAHQLRLEFEPAIYGFTEEVSSSIFELRKERQALQEFIDEQRGLAVADLNTSGELIIDQTGQRLTEVIEDTGWLLIFLALIFALIFGGIPFFAGYMVGKSKFKKNNKPE